jgi:hypothetical protein
VSQLCEQFQLQPTVFYRWSKQLFDNGPAALGRHRSDRNLPDVRQRRIAALEKRLETRESREAEQEWMISLTQGRFDSQQVGRAIGNALSQEVVDKSLPCKRLRRPSIGTSVKEMNTFLSTPNERARKSGEMSLCLANSRLATIAKTQSTADDFLGAFWEGIGY